MDWYIPVAGIFAGIPPLLVHDIPLWSLLSFFVVDVVFYPLYRFTKSSVVIAFAAFILLFILKNIIFTFTVNCWVGFLCNWI